MISIEESLITLMENADYEGAHRLLEQNQILIDNPSQRAASAVTMLLALVGEYESSISYSEYHLKRVPSADLYFNYAYTLECLGKYNNAIVAYQCARLYSLDDELRDDATKNIQRLRFPDLSEKDLSKHLTYMNELRTYILAQLQNPTLPLRPEDYIVSTTPVVITKPRILYGTMEIANHMAHYTRFFRNKGFDVFSLDYYPSYLKYDCDFSFDLNVLSGEKAWIHSIQNAADLIADYDVFHFLFNRTLTNDGRDLMPMRILNKAVFMHNLGSEIRIPSIARKHHPYWCHAEDYLSHLNEDVIKSNLTFFSSMIDNCIVNDNEMLSYVKPYYKQTHMIGLPIDLDKYPFVGISNCNPIKIVHAPTNQSVKGSKFFESAIAVLKERHEINYRRIERTNHEDAMKLYADADIILDELIIGAYGSLTIECLAMGKCVVTFINPGFETPHGEEIPVWSVNPENVVERLEQLLTSISLRNELSLKGRQYVERNNDVDLIGKKLFDLYVDTIFK